MAKIDKIQEVAVSKLVPYERNAKQHPAEQVELIARSIKEYGFLNPCLIDKDYKIIAGHGRVEAAKKLGLEKVPCVFVEGLTDAQYRAYVLADNRLTELGEWDMDLVANELRSLEDVGFDIDLTGFLPDDEIIDLEPIPDDGIGDDIEEYISGQRISAYGDIWELGCHRLMVGDSTRMEDVEALMDGDQADLLETDPPYNVSISNTRGMTIANDNMSSDSFYEFLYMAFSNAVAMMKCGASFYIWHADSNGLIFRKACEDAGLSIRQNLIWVKNHITPGWSDYQWMHEPCLYGWKEGAAHYFSERRNLATVIKSVDNLEDASREELLQMIYKIRETTTITYEKVPLADDLHPTMKPRELILKQIKNSSRVGNVVLDLFGGSGTTLLCCEELGRRCRMMEYDPKYADVIIRRYEEETGKKARKINV